MALDRLTKVDGGGISTTSDYRVGIITATKFVGPIEGEITAGDASFSGNVSIAGTLTYEDVTNIDSVGLITARSGLDLPGGQITVGNNIKLGAAGVITATSYRGDGSQLTGVTNTIINNNANNRIITGSGTADTLEAESSITYDGTKVLNISSSAGGFYQGTDTDGGVGLLEMGNGNVALQADTGNSIGSSKIQFFVDGSEKAKIDDGGRLLVGSAAIQYAASPLYVSSTGPVQGAFHSSSGGTNDQARIALGALANNPPYNRGVYLTAENNGAGHDFIVACSASHAAGPSEKIRITSAGKVGINSISPTYALEVDGGTQNTVIALRSSDAKAAISFLDNTSGGYGRATIGGEGDEVYITSGTGVEALRITNTGQITTRGAQSTGFNNAGNGDFGSFLTVNGGHTSNQWGILSLEGNTSASGYSVGQIQFINQNNANGSSGANVQSRLLAKIETFSVTSDSNAGDDSGGALRIFTKPEAAQPAERFQIDSIGRISAGKHGVGSYNDASEYFKIQSNDTSAVLSIIGSNDTHSTLALGDEDDFNRARIRADHTHDLLGFWTADNERLRLTDKGVLSSFLNTTGGQNTGNAYYHRPILEITHNAGTPPTQVKIITNIPWSGDATHAHSVRIAGFRYGGRDTVDLQICWHIYNNEFYQRVATSSGSYAPTITLAVENNKVVIHLTNPGYWPKFYVESLYHPYGSKEQAEGWSWTDNAISGDSGLPVNTVPYKWDAGGLSFNDSHNNNGQGDLTINDGNLVLASGHGISFADTADNSFATTQSELFDDYEEGSFTAILRSNSSPTNTNYSYNTSNNFTSYYTRIGNIVYVSIHMGNLHTSPDLRNHQLIRVEGLPYNAARRSGLTVVDGRGIYPRWNTDSQTTNAATFTPWIDGGDNKVYMQLFMHFTPYTAWATVHNSTSSSRIHIAGCYPVA